jgi:hypothetical protein
MLNGDHSRHGLEQLRDAQHRTHEQIRAADAAFARRLRGADELHAATEDDDLLGPVARLRLRWSRTADLGLLAERHLRRHDGHYRRGDNRTPWKHFANS